MSTLFVGEVSSRSQIKTIGTIVEEETPENANPLKLFEVKIKH